MIAARDVTLGVPGRTLLEHVSFEATAGELVAVLGRNGVGKTTLLRAAGGLHALTAGTILLDGRPIDAIDPLERARIVAFMVSDDSAIESLTVRDVVAAGRYPYHRWWEWRETPGDTAAIEAALAAVDMTPFCSRRFATLSSGERQRIWLALGLAQEAPVLLLDEPTSHLDVRVSHEILHLLRIQARAGKTVICVLHDMNEALEFADRVMVLAQGSILTYDAPDAVAQSGLLGTAYGIELETVRSSTGAVRVFPKAGAQ